MLQTWAPDGTPMMQLGDRILKFMGSSSIGWDYTGAAQSGFIDDARFTAYPNMVPIVVTLVGGFDPLGSGPQISVSGNRLTWQYPIAAANNNTRVNQTFVYGIF